MRDVIAALWVCFATQAMFIACVIIAGAAGCALPLGEPSKLIACHSGTAVDGAPIWTGTYQNGDVIFTRDTSAICPETLRT
jgi:hypothetical protein